MYLIAKVVAVLLIGALYKCWTFTFTFLRPSTIWWFNFPPSYSTCLRYCCCCFAIFICYLLFTRFIWLAAVCSCKCCRCLCPSCSVWITNVQVCAMVKNYYELRRTKPRLRRLRECLEEAPYSGETFESDSPAHTVNLITWLLGVWLQYNQWFHCCACEENCTDCSH